MDRTVASLLGALGALVVGSHAQAAIPSQSASQVLAASSYADLLRPIPNALETLQTLDAAPAAVEEAQYYPYYAPPRPYYYRGYHHHHRFHRRFHHHHNYHHHHGYHRRWR